MGYIVLASLICSLLTYVGHNYIMARFEIRHYEPEFFILATSIFWPIGFAYIIGECATQLAEKHRQEAQKLIVARAKAEESKHRLQLSSTEDLLDELSMREDLRHDTMKRLKS